jgi:hypothetical protein
MVFENDPLPAPTVQVGHQVFFDVIRSKAVDNDRQLMVSVGDANAAENQGENKYEGENEVALRNS